MACDMNRVPRRGRATTPTRTSEKPTWRRWTGHSDSGAPGAWKASCNCGMASVVASSNSRSRPAVVLRARGQPGRLSGVLGTMLRSIVRVEPKRNVLVSSDYRTRIRTTETRVSDSGLTAPRHSWTCFVAAYLRRGFLFFADVGEQSSSRRKPSSVQPEAMLACSTLQRSQLYRRRG